MVRVNGLFPDYLEGYFNNLIGAMKAGSPKIRDKHDGHGAAPGQPAVPEHIASFALHLAASSASARSYRLFEIPNGFHSPPARGGDGITRALFVSRQRRV